MTNVASLVRTEPRVRPTVIALHCSGATRSEWQQLERVLGNRFSLIAPDLIGSGGSAHWAGAHAFELLDEAKNVVRIIDAANGPVHLVGHSYGGAVALRAAVERPTQVASMALYEPAAFHVLNTMGPDGISAHKEITAIAGDISLLVLSGDYHTAAMRFFEFWNGEGSWSAIRVSAQDDLVRYIPKVCLEFSAALNERTSPMVYRRLNFPVFLPQGEHAPTATQLIASQLSKVMRFASLQTVYGAGHMGPFSHAGVVSEMMADWIARAEPRLPAGEDNSKLDIHRAA